MLLSIVHSVAVGLLATAVAALLEGWLLLLLTTSRLEGNGLAFALGGAPIALGWTRDWLNAPYGLRSEVARPSPSRAA